MISVTMGGILYSNEKENLALCTITGTHPKTKCRKKEETEEYIATVFHLCKV